MDLGLAGKKALVTGGTRGIGRAIAEELASEGCHLGICARDQSRVQETVAALAKKNVTATGCAVDVGQAEALKGWVSESYFSRLRVATPCNATPRYHPKRTGRRPPGNIGGFVPISQRLAVSA